MKNTGNCLVVSNLYVQSGSISGFNMNKDFFIFYDNK